LVARILTCALLLLPAAAIAADPLVPRSSEREDRDRAARAALALAGAEARPTAAAVALAPPPRFATPATYAEGHKQAVVTGRPLVVYVSCPSRPVVGADVCETAATTFGDVKGPAVVVCVPQGDRLTVDSSHPCPVGAERVKAAVDEAAKKMGAAGPPKPMPAAPKPLDWQLRNAGCICGDSCQCAAGTCPGCCPVAAVTPATAPVVVGYQYQQQCVGGVCRVVAVPVYGQAAATPGVVVSRPFSSSPDSPVASAPSDGSDALAEVNAKRASRGLRPYLRDEGLTAAARACAQHRAAHLMFGHTANDFAFVPAGTRCDATGCAAYPASYGWLSCGIWDNYTRAGAAWAMGRDGKRYMHLYLGY
jgi:hypothetical protein